MSWLIVLDEDNQPTPKKKVFKDRLNPLETLTDTECIQRFRTDKNGILDLCQLLQVDLIRPTTRRRAIPVITQVLNEPTR